MNILINSETLDVTLDKEKNLGEVYDSLCTWMKGAGMYPLSLRLDSTEHDISGDTQWKGRPVDAVDSFELQAGSINSVRQKEMITVLDYLLLLKTIVEKIQAGKEVGDSLSSASAEYAYVRPAVLEMLRLSEKGFSEDFGIFDQLMNEARNGSLDPQKAGSLHEKLEQLRVILLDRLHESVQPLKDIKNTSEVIRHVLPLLEEAGISLQTGNEKDAYTLILRISEITAKFVRTMEILTLEYPQHSFTELQEVVKKLGTIIDEVNEAIHNGDGVVLADILEYDLHEVLNSLVEHIDALDLETA